jgi:nitrite reductase/ring-hydroxylating ferredoxin subunit
MGATASLSFAAKSYYSEAEPSVEEFEIEFASSLNDGEMKELKVGPKDDDKILISRVNGKLHAVGNYCSHFGAPLATGQLFDDKVVCPWHAAAFSVVTGTLEGAPGIDGLPVF